MKLPCPKCKTTKQVSLRGHYRRKSDGKKIRRFNCLKCGKSFSSQTHSHDYRHRKRWLDQLVFRGLSKGMSQRGMALVYGVVPRTISTRLKSFGRVCAANLDYFRMHGPKHSVIQFDEMQTSEHTKLKPVTIPLAVNATTREVLAVGAGSIPANGKNAALSRAKYGPRADHRGQVLDQMFLNLRKCCPSNVSGLSDMSVAYPGRFKKTFPEGNHTVTKGRRGCVVGQGELKEGGFDPLFKLNHTAAMFRDNLKRLARRTWCGTKKIPRLIDALNIYAWSHNLYVKGEKLKLVALVLSTN